MYIVGGRILTMAGREIPEGILQIRNGKIAQVGARGEVKLQPEEGEQVVEGLKVMLALFDNAKGYICIEDNKPDCIRKMEELVKDIPRIEVRARKGMTVMRQWIP